MPNWRTNFSVHHHIATSSPSPFFSHLHLLQALKTTPDVQSRLLFSTTAPNLKVRVRRQCWTAFRVFHTPPLFQPESYQNCRIVSADKFVNSSFQNGHLQLLLKAHHRAGGDEEGVGGLRILHRRVQQVHPLHLVGQHALEVLRRLLHQRPGQVHSERLQQWAEGGQPGLQQAAQPGSLGDSRTEDAMVA